MSLYDRQYEFYVAGYEGRSYPIPLSKIAESSRRPVRKAYREGVAQHRSEEISLRHLFPRSAR
jgi:hypothetical protein